MRIKKYLKQAGIAADQLLNTVCGGWADETLSSRAYRMERDGVRSWLRRLIDGLFFWEEQHCFKSYVSEQERLHLPPEMRSPE